MSNLQKKMCCYAKYFAALGSSIIIGMLMLVAVYALPVTRMKVNVVRSGEIFLNEGINPQIVHGYEYMQLDTYTDDLMLEAAIYGGVESTVNKAVNNYHVDATQSPHIDLFNYANEATTYDYLTVPYGRYWHGYLVPLKLLLLFLDYGDIRILNFFLQNFLLFMIIRKLYRVHMEKYIPAFLIMIFVLNPLTAALSLQFSAVYYITLLSMIWFLHLVEIGKAKESEMNRLFFVIGIMTAYFDFLTYPFVPFGVLIVLYLVINGENIEFAGIKPLLQKGVLWGAGYGGMWSGKWIAGSILTKQNLLANALNQVFLRTSTGFYDGEEGYTRLDALWKNIGVLLKWPFLLAFFGGVFLACLLRKSTVYIMRQNAPVICFLTVVAFLPIIWILITAGHAYGHHWFTYKEFGVSVFALFSLGIYLGNLGNDKKGKDDLRE